MDALHRALPRLLSSFNADTTAGLAGVGDRYHWSWKLIDFPNGTFQAAVHGLAILLHLKQLPANLSESEVLGYIRLAISGLKSITAKNGSLDEALPNEASYCVTALVASDVLGAYKLLNEYLSSDEKHKWLEVLRPLINFLLQQDEHHGVISNHLASGALAMYRWHAATGDPVAEERGSMWLKRIFKHQSSEGWFSEYGGADPGYQTWCTTQLAQLYLLRPDLEILDPLARSLSFLVHAAHPDGSFGGSYGCRNTRFLLPGGIELLCGADANAAALSAFARESITRQACVTLDCMDGGNLVPFFNDYALAVWAESTRVQNVEKAILPCHANSGRQWFPESGWLIDSGPEYYSIVNMKRGGAAVHFSENTRRIDDPGVVARDPGGRLYASQLSSARDISNIQIGRDKIVVEFPMFPVKRPVPGAVDFIILRLLSISIFKSLGLGNMVKRLLVNFLIKGKSGPAGHVIREFGLGEEFTITDSIEGITGANQLSGVRHFSAIHMASQGYWQRNDGELQESE